MKFHLWGRDKIHSAKIRKWSKYHSGHVTGTYTGNVLTIEKGKTMPADWHNIMRLCVMLHTFKNYFNRHIVMGSSGGVNKDTLLWGWLTKKMKN